MDFKTTLLKWIRQLTYGNPDKYCKFDTSKKGYIRTTLYSDRYAYHIVANIDSKYLGCIMTCRKSRTGEDWFRGNDLPDGIFCEKTWNNILRGIVRNELVQLVPKVESKVDIPKTEENKK